MSYDMFTKKLLVKRGGETRLVSAIEQGKFCWFVFKVNPILYSEYQQAIKQNIPINLTEYGIILDSGWGDPSSCI